MNTRLGIFIDTDQTIIHDNKSYRNENPVDGSQIIYLSDEEENGEHIQTAKESVTVKFFDYLDWRINPEHLIFNEVKPLLSELKPENVLEVIKHEDKTYLSYCVIGQGNFGRVFLAQNAKTHEWIAIKKCSFIPPIEEFQDEVRGLALSNSLIFSNDSERTVGINLLEGYELSKVIESDLEKNFQSFSLLQKIAIAKSLLDKLSYLIYHLKIFHRDIKEQNVFFDVNMSADFCDFATAIVLGVNQKTIKDKLVGTVEYLLPSAFNDSGDDDSAVEYSEYTEVYALARIFTKLFGMEIPKNKIDAKNLHHNDIPINIPLALYKLVLSMLNKMEGVTIPTSIEAGKELDNIWSECGKSEAHNVCVISIGEFLKLNSSEKMQFVKNIISKKINSIVLQMSESTTTREYAVCRHYLTKNNILNIAPFFVSSPSPKAAFIFAKTYYNEKFRTQNTNVFSYNIILQKLNEEFKKDNELDKLNYRFDAIHQDFSNMLATIKLDGYISQIQNYLDDDKINSLDIAKIRTDIKNLETKILTWSTEFATELKAIKHTYAVIKNQIPDSQIAEVQLLENKLIKTDKYSFHHIQSKLDKNQQTIKQIKDNLILIERKLNNDEKNSLNTFHFEQVNRGIFEMMKDRILTNPDFKALRKHGRNHKQAQIDLYTSAIIHAENFQELLDTLDSDPKIGKAYNFARNQEGKLMKGAGAELTQDDLNYSMRENAGWTHHFFGLFGVKIQGYSRSNRYALALKADLISFAKERFGINIPIINSISNPGKTCF